MNDTTIQPEAPEQPEVAPQPQVQAPETNEPKKPKRKGLIIAIIAILLLAAALVAGYWYVQDQNAKEQAALNAQIKELQKQASDTKDSTTTATTTDDYKDWKTYTTKYEKLTLKYPASYTIAVNSTPDTQIVTPGMDRIVLKGPGGTQMTIDAGIAGIGGACPDAKVLKADALTLLSQKAYINYTDSGKGLVDGVLLASTANEACIGGLDSKNVVQSGGGKEPASILASFKKTSLNTSSLSTYQSDTDVQNGVLIIKSFTY